MKYPVIVLGLLAGLVSLQAEAAAGRFQFVSGEVKVTSAAGKDRLARKGDEISQGETITSSAGATAQVRMQDEGLIIVRPDTKLRITTFQFNGKADGTESSLISLVTGGFRAITGIIGRVNKDKYKIETPTATIGIRGTDHEPMFIPNPVAGLRAIGEPGTYDKVNSGAAVLSTTRGTVLINPNQAGFVANIANAVPKVLTTIPAFYQPPTKDEPQILPSATPATQAGSGGTTTSTVATTTVLKPVSSTLLAPISSTRLQTVGTATVAPATVSTIKSTSLSTTTIAPVKTTTIAPVSSTTIAPISSTTTIAPISTTTIAPISTTTIAPISTTTIAPISTTTIAPVSTTTIAPTTTIQPISTTIIAPISTTTIAPTTTTIQPITTFSDRRLKRNIKRVGTHRLGIGIYEFDYVWGEHARGVMADEVKQVMPDAVIRDKSGYDMVDYSKLN